ncbi:DUF2955 domain-containing protein [Tropicimonas sp. IMCC6043]|uniref:DUF2955 domain-containing protein n=1 Tax=Tropicimonas sp. IMCC6043 TaxID=2510645 RepID=UPI00101DCBC6|nr:DUF2955 domain-containing protein [Tropicimonas sp. IMCC6043]RYH10540.1 DUF2955 domain-containing protein [Tropicimonas sp. IMCC6043]
MPTDIRRAFGITAVFAAGLFLGWPMAVVGAVLTALLLRAPAALSLSAILRLVLVTAGMSLLSWLLFSALLPYPAVYLGAMSVGVVLSFAWVVSGAGTVAGVLALLATMLLPNVILMSRDLGLTLAVWIPLNLLIAGIVSGLAFSLFPTSPSDAPARQAQEQADFRPARRITRMSLVTLPFALVFFLSGSSAVLVLFFVALLSLQLAATPDAGPAVARAMLRSNALGAAVAVLCYELTVVAPSEVTPVLLCLLTCLSLDALARSEHPFAPYAGSAITTALIVYGGSIGPFADEADVKGITRVLQIAGAALYVNLAYIVVDAFWPEEPSGEALRRSLREAIYAGRRHRSGASGTAPKEIP